MKVVYALDELRQTYVFRGSIVTSVEYHLEKELVDHSSLDYFNLAAKSVNDQILNNPKTKIKGIDDLHQIMYLLRKSKNVESHHTTLLLTIEHLVQKIIDAQDKTEEVQYEYSEKLYKELNFNN